MRKGNTANARECALSVLVACRRNGAWADAALKAQLGKCALSAQDAALCSRIVYGVMQNELLLNWYLSAYCTQKLDHLQPPLSDILRIGAYQILFLDKVPDHAAVSESVELCRTNGRSAASGLVNAVLRKVAQNKSNLPPLPEGNIARLSVAYSHPQWLSSASRRRKRFFASTTRLRPSAYRSTRSKRMKKRSSTNFAARASASRRTRGCPDAWSFPARAT